jgi:hypothetical protein
VSLSNLGQEHTEKIVYGEQDGIVLERADDEAITSKRGASSGAGKLSCVILSDVELVVEQNK